MSSLIRYVFHDHPTPAFTGATAVLSAAALTTTPSFIPLVLLLAILHLYMRMAIPRKHAFARLIGVWIATIIGTCIAHSPASLHALSSGWTSMLSLAVLSGASSAFALLALYLDLRLGLGGPLTRLLFFPATWATVMGILSAGPVGRLFTWSPVLGIDAYRWMRPFSGPWGIDWVVAAWAITISHLVGMWVQGTPDKEETAEPAVGDLLSIEGDVDISDVPHTSASPSKQSWQPSYPVLILAGALLVLTVPSYVTPLLPLPSRSSTTVPLSVGCVLPAPVTGSGDLPSLANFIEDSRTIADAKLIIWPEGAVRFNDAADRNRTLELIRSKVLASHQGQFIGISFEEGIPADSRVGARHLRRNGFLIMGSDGRIHHEYHKRHLVPVTESFSMAASLAPPNITVIDWPIRKISNRRSDIRPIPITSSICLDFASASPFASLPTRPALILAPARTWHVSAGLAMWEQAKARAEELGSTLLWCDGGEGGVSGVAGIGAGAGQLFRAGQGTWQTTVAVHWPIKEERTVYAASGDWGMLLVVWAFVGVGGIPSIASALIVGRQGRSARGGPLMIQGAGGIWRRLVEWKRAATSRVGEQQPLLG